MTNKGCGAPCTHGKPPKALFIVEFPRWLPCKWCMWFIVYMLPVRESLPPFVTLTRARVDQVHISPQLYWLSFWATDITHMSSVYACAVIKFIIQHRRTYESVELWFRVSNLVTYCSNLDCGIQINRFKETTEFPRIDHKDCNTARNTPRSPWWNYMGFRFVRSGRRSGLFNNYSCFIGVDLANDDSNKRWIADLGDEYP